ncbi:type II toxin-antitoxin system HipA family toxin [Limimaricola sp. ASW11-118]|uniref:Type II toxin-antitoxin system HipA family toxin n=1 Tax=Limimaricola litoreus TaxID=2955316 RepID=A0A9X2JQ34_9RHOB|nr:type II toxin-antitoxin system HipA family toxin [Limimaricola litoreus]
MTTTRIHALSKASSAFIWVWLPSETQPVPAGRLHRGTDGRHDFGYMSDYLERSNAIALGPDLPLAQGMRSLPGPGLTGTLRDALPGAWGRRVTRALQLGQHDADAGADEIGDIAYGLLAGTDGIGALSFQASATSFETRIAPGVELEALAEAARRTEQGLSLPGDLAEPLVHAVAIGGTSPKVLVNIKGRSCIAKFGNSRDPHDALRAEYMGLRLAQLCHIDVPRFELRRLGDRLVLLVGRFDREESGAPRAMVSGQTLLDLIKAPSREVCHGDVFDAAAEWAREPEALRRELFRRAAFDSLLGRAPAPARSHTLFWTGQAVELTPALGLKLPNCIPHGVHRATALCVPDGAARVTQVLDMAPGFGLEPDAAAVMLDGLFEGIRQHHAAVASEAEVTQTRPAA